VLRHRDAKMLPNQNIVRGMSKDRFTCFSWSTGLRNCTGIIVPNTLENCKIMIPYKEGRGGNLMGKIPDIPQQSSVKVRNNAWIASGSVEDGPYCIWSTPGNAVIVINRPVYMAISEDPFTSTKESKETARELKQEKGWGNIDDAIGFVCNQELTLGEPKEINSIYTAVLSGVTNDDCPVSIYFCNVSAKDTKKLAKKTKIQRNGETILVNTEDPDGTKYTLSMNLKTGKYTFK